ncbi:hypothetical protein LCM4579_22160 [Ensifer sp. LCM 4579]|nr:hypothetical protein LCM4579_22160 [Ensifer sp. LCM 4579]
MTIKPIYKDKRMRIGSFLGYELNARRSLTMLAVAVLISIPLWLVLSLTVAGLRFSSVVWIPITFALLGMLREARTDEDGFTTRLIFEAVVSAALGMIVSIALRAAGV